MRIKTKLTVLFLAVAMIPMLFIGNIVFYNSERALQEQILHVLDVSADVKTKSVSDFFVERKQDLFILQNAYLIKKFLPVGEQFSHDPSNPSYVEAKHELDSFLRLVQKAYGYVDIMLLDRQGNVIYVSNPKHEVELNKADHDKEVILSADTADVFVGGVHRADNKERPFVLDMAGPVYDSVNEVVGFIHVELSMNPVYEIINKASSFEKTMEVLLVKKTADNKVLFISPLKALPDAILKRTVEFGSTQAVPAQKALLGETGLGFSVDYRGKDVLSAWRPIPELGWGLVAKVDVEEAFDPIVKLKKAVGFLLGFISLLLVVIAFAVARSISAPVLKLRHGAEMIGGGHWDHSIDVTSKDEFGDLAKSFREMARNLKWLMQKEKEFILAEARVDAEKQKADELRVINQQLVASEQQLKAANQQLLASEQQLKAANQQLAASEQQLRAANQQLSANEQALKEAKTSLEQKVRERTFELEEARLSLEIKVAERTRELQEKMAYLEKMNKLMIDREVRVIELKKEVNRLCRESGNSEPYSVGV